MEHHRRLPPAGQPESGPEGGLRRERRPPSTSNAGLPKPRGANVVLGAAARSAFRLVNRFVPWHRLGVRLGLLNLDAVRHVLRRDNLIDTEQREAPPVAVGASRAAGRGPMVRRSFDGTGNDLSDLANGRSRSSVGRNLAPDYCHVPRRAQPILVSRQAARTPARSARRCR